MNQPLADKTFIFNEHIDTSFLNDLYAGDYVMIEETFEDVLEDYDTLLDALDASYLSQNIPALKSAVHKIKPLFGFVGLLAIQSQCQQFEKSCEDNPPPESLVTHFTLLKNTLLQGKSIIEDEKIRLALFNSK